MIPVLLATVIAAYGVWYGLFVKEFKAVHPWTGRTKYRYQPKPYLRAIVVAVSLTILITVVAEPLRLLGTHMTINTNIVGWFRLLLFAVGAVYLWRSALSPKGNEPRGRSDRAVRLFGAVLLSAVVIYFLGFGLGFYR